MELTDLIGPMLGAEFLYAEGEVAETNSELPTPVVHTFWSYRKRWRVERDDGVVLIDGPDRSITLVDGRTIETAPRPHGPGFHLAERLLRPRYAPVWGRPGEDWQLTDEVEDGGDGLVSVRLRGTGGRHTERGSIVVDPRSGHLHRVTTPGFEWTLLRFQEESPRNVEELFEVPPSAPAAAR